MATYLTPRFSNDTNPQQARKLEWDNVNEHIWETGVSYAVLYLQDSKAPSTAVTVHVPNSYGTGTTATNDLVLDSEQPYYGGVAWNGLTGVTESPDGADTEDTYANNAKYLSIRAVENLNGTITAYTYPDEFAACDGTVMVEATTAGSTQKNRVRIKQQARKAFGLCYRTEEGNDTESQSYAYRLHLVYGATCSPSDKDYTTINDSPEAVEFSWEFETTPIDMKDLSANASAKSACIEIASLDVAQEDMENLEACLYGQDSGTGTSGSVPFLPTPEQIATLLLY